MRDERDLRVSDERKYVRVDQETISKWVRHEEDPSLLKKGEKRKKEKRKKRARLACIFCLFSRDACVIRPYLSSRLALNFARCKRIRRKIARTATQQNRNAPRELRNRHRLFSPTRHKFRDRANNFSAPFYPQCFEERDFKQRLNTFGRCCGIRVSRLQWPRYYRTA